MNKINLFVLGKFSVKTGNKTAIHHVKKVGMIAGGTGKMSFFAELESNILIIKAKIDIQILFQE